MSSRVLKLFLCRYTNRSQGNSESRKNSGSLESQLSERSNLMRLLHRSMKVKSLEESLLPDSTNSFSFQGFLICQCIFASSRSSLLLLSLVGSLVFSIINIASTLISYYSMKDLFGNQSRRKQRILTHLNQGSTPLFRHRINSRHNTHTGSPTPSVSNILNQNTPQQPQPQKFSKTLSTNTNSKIRMFPQDYISLFKPESFSRSKPPKCSKLGRPTFSSRKVHEMSKQYQRMQKHLLKQQIPTICQQIMRLIERGRKMNIPEQEIIRLIKRCSIGSNRVVKMVLDMNKYSENVKVVKNCGLLVEKIKREYLDNLENNTNTYLIHYLKLFRDNLEGKMKEIDERVMMSIQRSVDEFNNSISKDSQVSLEKQPSQHPKDDSNQDLRIDLKSIQPTLTNSSKDTNPTRMPKSSYILNKLPFNQLSKGSIIQISSFTKDRNWELEKIKTIFKYYQRLCG